MEHTIQFWDKVAAKYARTPIKNLESYTYTLERTRTYLGADDKVLEIGAGTGSTALELAPSVGHITATDISPRMTELAQDKARAAGIANAEFVAAEAMVPGLDGPYDAVLAHNLLHLVEDLPGVLARIHEVTRPGGVFISKTFCKPTGFGPPLFWVMRLALPVMQHFGKAPFVAMLTIRELEEVIIDAGFSIVETGNYPKGEIRRYIVARKAV